MSQRHGIECIQFYPFTRWPQVYRSFPLGVMRADFWRLAILYVHGGLYSDVDTRCIRPVHQWLPTAALPTTHVDVGPGFEAPAAYAKLEWRDCSLVVGMENEVHLCQVRYGLQKLILAAAAGSQDDSLLREQPIYIF